MVGRKRKSKHNFDSIRKVMNYKENYGPRKLVCITNGKEVLRVSRENAKEYFFDRVSASKEELELKQARGFQVNIDLGYYYMTLSIAENLAQRVMNLPSSAFLGNDI